MRITNSMMMDNVLSDINRGMLRMDRYSSQLASNRKMVRLSDSPIGLLNSLYARNQLRQIEQYQQNIVTTRKWTQQAETTLNDMQSIVTRIYEATIDAGGTKNEDDRKNIATLIKQLKTHLIESCNTAISDKYIFGGYNVAGKPFEVLDNGKILYNGMDLSGDPVMSAGFGDTSVFNPSAGEGITDMVWRGSIDPPKNYAITDDGAGNLTFTNKDDPADTITVALGNPEPGKNEIDLSKHGLGIINFNYNPPTNDADPHVIGAAQLAWSISNGGTNEVKSELYNLTHDIVLGNTGTNYGFQNAGGVTGIQWNGPITASNKYSISVDGDNKLVFKDERGVEYGKADLANAQETSPGSGVYELDLTGMGLGKISWTGSLDADGAVFGGGFGVAPGGLTPQWAGPISANGKFSLSVDANDPASLIIKDSKGKQVTSLSLEGATSVDLSAYGLGEITWGGTQIGNKADAEQMAAAIAKVGTISSNKSELTAEISNAGVVTTRLGDAGAENIRFEIGFEVTMDATFNGISVVGTGDNNLFKIIDNLLYDLENGADTEKLSKHLTKLQGKQQDLITNIVQLGARTVKLDTMDNRYSMDFINAEAVRTDIEDIDQAAVIMNYKFAEAIYRQALAAGAQIIQPTLMDFLR